ncbi:Membrane protein involved in the export of O-antigen and teichoic acid [Pseudobutyrivibrio xylanivorans]|uniref:Membrane protein involved in the export of O-antigen and teichoic acid n=2 Tax=Pseudobutyrivibrio xylanivorans TaxID=185007 RepID=A0A1G5RZY1_PSEXY|nr:Membrane protein involved in the export of O-antigen and teichoic acid [Pseudobutyrivibrio xylanivorans]
MLFGVVLKLYQLLIPFVMRTIMLYLMGPGYTGLNSLFVSVLQVLNLAELGVGSAMVFSMYKPIVEDNEAEICALMRLYKIYYRVIGLVVMGAGLVLTPFIPTLIKSDLPADVNIYVLYFMNLFATALTYWLFAYKNSILTAYQRSDINSKITIITDTIKYAIQIIVLVLFRNYYLYVLAILFSQVLNNITTAIISTKLYPQYKPVGKLPSEEVKVINKRIKDLFTSKVGSVIITSADSIVISAFLGLKMLTIYQNYYYPISAVMGVVQIIFASCTAGIGNSIIVESQEKNMRDLKKFTFIIAWIAGFCTTCFLAVLQPFMEIWAGKKLMVGYPLVVCMAMYFFIFEINALLNLYKDAAGIWHEDRFRPLATSLANLFMNIVMVQFWGLYGVILSTVISMLIVGMPWLLHNLFTVMFDMKYLKGYLLTLFKYVLVTGVVCIIIVYICSFINYHPLMTMVIRLLVCTIVVNIIFLLVYRSSQEFKESLILVNKMTKGKVPFLNKYGRE